MSTFKALCVAVLLIVFKVELNKGAALPSNIYEDCSFLVQTKKAECSSYLGGKKPPLLLVSLDGFRNEYLTRIGLENDPRYEGLELAAPTLSCLAKNGLSAPFMLPSFPTKTFPNHFAIVTGLYPESHSIIANSFYDPILKEEFKIRNPDANDPKWWGKAEPIWSTVRKQGKKSATYFWPGSDVLHVEEERKPNFFLKYDKSVTFQMRVEQILDWISLPVNERPALLTMYFDEPDITGHASGPTSANVTDKVSIVDRHIRMLFDGLMARNIYNCVNVIIVSDHGMADAPPEQLLVDLSMFVPDIQESTIFHHGPVPLVRPRNDIAEEQNRIGNALGCRTPHMRVFNKMEAPYRMHYTKSNRIPELMLDMDLSWRGIIKEDPKRAKKGSHGWDNLFPEMHAIFMAIGPAFKTQTVVEPFENVQLFNLFCTLLDVKPTENNGTWGALHHLLVNPPAYPEAKKISPKMPPILRKDAESQKKKRTACALVNSRGILPATPDTDIVMDMTKTRETERLATFVPLGVPVDLANKLTPSKANYAVLVNEEYVTGFDVELGVPLWAAYNVIGERVSAKDGQWIEDPRLKPNQIGSCQRLNSIAMKEEVINAHLFPRAFANRAQDVWLDTNLLEVPIGMTKIMEAMVRLMNEAAGTYGPLNVISGPTRQHSPAIFYVITACKTNGTRTGTWNLKTCPIENRDIQSFILPIRPMKYERCFIENDFIAYHVATLKDVEIVTELSFFPELPIEDKLRLLTKTTFRTNLLIDPRRTQLPE